MKTILLTCLVLFSFKVTASAQEELAKQRYLAAFNTISGIIPRSSASIEK